MQLSYYTGEGVSHISEKPVKKLPLGLSNFLDSGHISFGSFGNTFPEGTQLI